jgi:hypothetical protein
VVQGAEYKESSGLISSMFWPQDSERIISIRWALASTSSNEDIKCSTYSIVVRIKGNKKWEIVHSLAHC